MDALAEHRQRHVSRFAARFLVRSHLGLIFLATAAAAVLASHLLFGAGLDPLAVRGALAVLLAYALFFALARLWVFYSTGVGPRETVFRPGGGLSAGRGASVQWDDGVRVVRSMAELGGGKRSGGTGGSRVSLDIDDGLVLVFVLVLLAGVLGGAALYLVWRAPTILPEAAFAALLASGLIRSARRADARGWAVQQACPTAARLAALVDRCV